MNATPLTIHARQLINPGRAIRRRLAQTAATAVAVLTLLAGAAVARAPRQAPAPETVRVTLVVLNLGSAPAGTVQLDFRAGFTSSDLVSAEVASGDPGLGLLSWQDGQLRLAGYGAGTEAKVVLEFALPGPDARIVGDAQIPSGTVVDAQPSGGTPQLIGSTFVIATGTQLKASRGPSLDVAPEPARPGASVALVGSLAGRCAAGARVTLLSAAFAHRHRAGRLPAVHTLVGPGDGFAAVATVARATPPGRYPITARCDAHNLGILAHLRVGAPTTGAGSEHRSRRPPESRSRQPTA